MGLVRRGPMYNHSYMRANNSTVRKVSTGSIGERCNVPCFKTDVVRRLRAAMPPEESLAAARVVFGALADRARLQILHALSKEELCVCDVAHVLGTSISTASHHLRKLRDLKLLRHRNDGKMVYYALRAPFVAELIAEGLKQARRL